MRQKVALGWLPSRYRDDYSSTWFRPSPAIAVSHRRVEIDGVFRLQKEFLAANLDGQGALQNIEKFDPGLFVRLQFFERDLLKICQKGTQLTLGGPVVQALKVILQIGRARALREANPFFPPYYAHDPAFPLVGEEVIQSNPEDHRYAQQGGKSGKQLSPLQLGQQCRGKARMLTQFHQSHALAQAQGAQFFTDGITPQAVGNRVRHAACHFSIIKLLCTIVNTGSVKKPGLMQARL